MFRFPRLMWEIRQTRRFFARAIRREWTELREHFEQIMEDYRTRDVCGFDLVTAVPPRGRLAPRSVYRQQERKVSR